MGGVVAQQLEGVGMGPGDDLDPGVAAIEAARSRGSPSILNGERRLGEARADRGGQLGAGDRPVEPARGTVGERDRDHGRAGIATFDCVKSRRIEATDARF